jgi:hypothetical protein
MAEYLIGKDQSAGIEMVLQPISGLKSANCCRNRNATALTFSAKAAIADCCLGHAASRQVL